MPDLAVFSAAYTSLKTATELAKLLANSSATLEKAELRLRLADLLNNLVDAKVELAQVQDALSDRDQRIAELEAAFELKDQLVREGDAYYVKADSGSASGVPLCLRCWESDHRQRQLVYPPDNSPSKVCPTCNTKYDRRRTPTR